MGNHVARSLAWLDSKISKLRNPKQGFRFGNWNSHRLKDFRQQRRHLHRESELESGGRHGPRRPRSRRKEQRKETQPRRRRGGRKASQVPQKGEKEEKGEGQGLEGTLHGTLQRPP